jgi:hypothetical protein
MKTGNEFLGREYYGSGYYIFYVVTFVQLCVAQCYVSGYYIVHSCHCDTFVCSQMLCA